ncbi:Transposase, Mutator family [Afipia sp. GAS231]|nr:Transposase, Mutator family [Afipia sp. GAS231]
MRRNAELLEEATEVVARNDKDSVVEVAVAVREIQGHLALRYRGVPRYDQQTDVTLDEVREPQSRPLESIYPMVVFDALRVKMGDEGMVKNKAVYVVPLRRARTCGPPTAPSNRGLPVEQNRARDNFQTGRGGAEKLALSRWSQPVAETRSRCDALRRDRGHSPSNRSSLQNRPRLTGPRLLPEFGGSSKLTILRYSTPSFSSRPLLLTWEKMGNLVIAPSTSIEAIRSLSANTNSFSSNKQQSRMPRLSRTPFTCMLPPLAETLTCSITPNDFMSATQLVRHATTPSSLALPASTPYSSM